MVNSKKVDDKSTGIQFERYQSEEYQANTTNQFLGSNYSDVAIRRSREKERFKWLMVTLLAATITTVSAIATFAASGLVPAFSVAATNLLPFLATPLALPIFAALTGLMAISTLLAFNLAISQPKAMPYISND